jgi:hydrogenase maturation protease
MSAEPRMLVIGIGNALRQDDSVGRIIARRIQRRRPAFRVVEHSGEASSLMELWRGAGTVFVVDCVRSGFAAGTIRRFDATRKPLPGRIFPISTHGFGLLEAVELARALKQLPKRLIIYGIEGTAYGNGGNLSPAVAKAVPQAARRVLEEAARAAGAPRTHKRGGPSRKTRT